MPLKKHTLLSTEFCVHEKDLKKNQCPINNELNYFILTIDTDHQDELDGEFGDCMIYDSLALKLFDRINCLTHK